MYNCLHFITILRLRNKYANMEFQITLETMQVGKVYKYKSKSALVKTHTAPLMVFINAYF